MTFSHQAPNENPRTPRQATTPEAYQRAQALLAGAERRQQIMGQAMHQAGITAPARANPYTGAGVDVVQQISQSAQSQMLAAHEGLALADQLAQQMWSQDATLAASHANAYGAVPEAAARSPTSGDIIDVEAKVVPTPANQPQT